MLTGKIRIYTLYLLPSCYMYIIITIIATAKAVYSCVHTRVWYGRIDVGIDTYIMVVIIYIIQRLFSSVRIIIIIIYPTGLLNSFANEPSSAPHAIANAYRPRKLKNNTKNGPYTDYHNVRARGWLDACSCGIIWYNII